MTTPRLPTFEDCIEAKRLSKSVRQSDVEKLMQWDATTGDLKLCGNAFLQHFMVEHIWKTSFEGKPTLEQTLKNPSKSADLYRRTCTKDETKLHINMPQAFTRWNPVCFLKPSAAKYIWNTLGHGRPNLRVLDFTAGWGGRMMGAMSLGYHYIGMDTNVNLKSSYDQMISEIPNGSSEMIWNDCRTVDLKSLGRIDLVFTSPPYANKEVYEHMTPFATEHSYYNDFLIPMLNRCLDVVETDGCVALNLNPEYYDALLRVGFRPADKTFAFLQSTRKTKDGQVKQEFVYCWMPTSQSPKESPGACSHCTRLELENKKLRELIHLLTKS